MIRYQPIFPFRRLAVIAEDRRPGRVDRSGAPLHRLLADWHHSGDPGNRDGEAEEADTWQAAAPSTVSAPAFGLLRATRS
jgi:hypothetical protein